MKNIKWQPYLIGLLTAALAFSLYYRPRQQQARKDTALPVSAQQEAAGQQAAVEEELAALQKQFNSYKLQSAADQAFIEGNYTTAFDYYTKAEAAGTLQPSLLPARRKQAEKVQAVFSALASAQNKIPGLKEKAHALEASKAAAEENAQNSQLQSLQLQDMISRQKKSIDSLQAFIAQQAENETTLRFVNEKGYKVFYLGDLHQKQADGKGLGIWETGGVYKGEWQQNKRHGQGTYLWADGDRYVGEYRQDQRTGIGTYYFKNGEKYVGEWLQDKRHGKGTTYNRKGKVMLQGIWKDDKYMHSRTKS